MHVLHMSLVQPGSSVRGSCPGPSYSLTGWRELLCSLWSKLPLAQKDRIPSPTPRESAALSPESSGPGSSHTHTLPWPHSEARARRLGLSRRFAHWSGGLQGDRLAGPRPRIFSLRKTCQVTDPTPVLGGSPSCTSGWGGQLSEHISLVSVRYQAFFPGDVRH